MIDISFSATILHEMWPYPSPFLQLAFQQHQSIQHLLFHDNLLLAIQGEQFTLSLIHI